MLIGISGKKQSGKDTSYQLIKKILMFSPRHVRKYAFASGVKEFGKKYFGIDPFEEDKEAVRFIWQGIGQLMRDEVDKEFWIKHEIEKYNRDKENHWGYESLLVGIITDVRYKNEAEYLIQAGYPVVRIVRDSIDSDDSHPSEVELDSLEFPYTIHNNGDLYWLEKQWKQTLKKIL